MKMNHTEFETQMNKLLIFYKDPPKKSEAIYWESLKDTSGIIFEKACDIIINTYDKTSFPMVPVFNQAIEQASRESSPSSSISSINCPYCRGIGVTILSAKGSSGVAHPCSCNKGRIYQRSFDKVRIKSERRREFLTVGDQQQEIQEPEQTPDPY